MSAAINRAWLNAVLVALALLALLPAGVVVGLLMQELAGGLAK